MKKLGLFIIGTDTDAGKTFVTSTLGGLIREVYENVNILKPIASGAKISENGEIFSEDAREILRLSNLPYSLERTINPICLAGEFSPKIAAKKSNVDIDMKKLSSYIKAKVNNSDYTIIEGAGGLTTPLTDEYRLDEWIKELGYPVLLVCDGKLGCLNRVLLTTMALKFHKIPLVGIILNDMANTDKELLMSNIKEIENYTGKEILAVLPKYNGKKKREEELNWAKKYIDIDRLINKWEKIIAS